MSLINPIQQPYPATRTGLDTVIESIQTQLATLPWITAPLLRAWNLPETRDGKLYRNPRIYSGDKEHFNSMFNDEQTATSFCIGVGSATPSEETEGFQSPILWNKRLDLIIHGDLKKIDDTKDYIFTEELIEQVLNVLSKTRGITISAIWSDDIQDIFQQFDLSEIERDFLYYPHFGIRFELDVSYRAGGIIC